MHTFGIAAAMTTDQAPTGLLWEWTATTGPLVVAISNPNDTPMQLTSLGAWSDARFAWVTSAPVDIAAHGTTNVSVTYTGLNTVTIEATASVAFTVSGGTSAAATATANHDNGL